MKAERSLVVVGAGVIGLAVARYAQRDGFAVTIVERGAPDHDSCSLGNAGMIVPSHFTPLAAPGVVRQGLRSIGRRRNPIYVRPRLDATFCRWGWHFLRSATEAHVATAATLLRDLSLLSLRCYEALAESCGNAFGLERSGLLMLCRSEHGLDEEAATAKLAERLGIEARVLTAAEIAALQPGLHVDVVGGVYYPLDCHLSPQRFTAALRRELEAGGARFAWQTEAREWRVDGNRVVGLLTDRGDFRADEFVLAAGAWSPRTTRGLDLRLPVEAGKGYSVTLPTPPARPRIGSILVEARIAVTPMPDGLRFAGTMEFGGLDESIDLERVRAMLEAIPGYFPQFDHKDFARLIPWQGLRPCSPDGLPYIGRVPRFANFSVATGHSMLGVSLAPATGYLMAEILAGRRPSVELSAFAPERFG